MDSPLDLSESVLFKGLSPEETAALEPLIRLQDLKRGELLFSQGEPASAFFLVLSGRIRIFKVAPDGREVSLHLSVPGEMFAEVPVFDGKGYPASASALIKTTVARVAGEGFVAVLETHPRIATRIIANLSGWLRSLTSRLEAESLKDAGSRIASYLLEESRRVGRAEIKLLSTKAQLAGLMGTSPETFSRHLARLRDEGLLEINGRRITILDGAGLGRVAEPTPAEEG